MEFPVTLDGRAVGSCIVEEQGLYWYLDCSCEVVSDRVERLYCGTVRLGVLLLEEDRFVLRRRLSKSTFPQLPPKSGVFSLKPQEEPVPWEGTVFGWPLSGFRLGDTLLISYEAESPCPCESLFCFFEIKDGFWRLPLTGLETEENKAAHL